MSETTTTKASKVKPCACRIGTGTECERTTSKAFAQGHDAKLSSRLATDVAEGRMDLEEATGLVRKAGGSEALVSKMRHSARLRTEKITANATKAATKDQ